MNFTFTDGILIASCFWILVSVLALVRGLQYGTSIKANAISEYWDNSIKVGFTIAYCYAKDPERLEGLCRLYLDPEYLETLKVTIVEAEHDESNPCC